MIAKIIVHGRDRTEAIARMKRTLEMTVIEGIKTSIPLHLKVLADEDFIAGRMSTSFMERYNVARPAGRPGAAPEDVRPWWRHVLTLHHKNRTLNKELKEAERALGDEPSERNYAWLRDVQDRLAAIEGTEASIEGFGALSGRRARGI